MTEVHAPTEAQEAARDLSRCREDAREDLTRARHRMGKLLLRKSIDFEGKAWSAQHRIWLRTLKFELMAEQAVFDEYLSVIESTEERLRRLETKLEELSQTEPYREPVGLLRCYRGIDTVTAMVIVTELFGLQRFESARELMAYLGLVPSEHSTGGRHHRGPITKTGNKHVRRLLIESSWHYRHPPRVGVKLRKRREGQPGWAIALADRAQARLHKKYWRMVGQTKPHAKAVTAVARELVGFIFGTLCAPKSGPRKPTKGKPVLSGKQVLKEARKQVA